MSESMSGVGRGATFGIEGRVRPVSEAGSDRRVAGGVGTRPPRFASSASRGTPESRAQGVALGGRRFGSSPTLYAR